MSYRNLHGDARLILRSLAELEIEDVSLEAVTAVLAGDEDRAHQALQELVDDDWLVETTSAAWELSAPARDWIGAHRNSLTTPAVEKAIAALADLHRAAMDPSPSKERAVQHAAEHRAEIAATAQALARLGDYESATQLAASAWQVAYDVHDADWWQRIARIGEHAAIRGRSPSALIDLLCRSADVFLAADDHGAAESQWIRALAVAKRLKEPGRIQEIHRYLGSLHRATGRLHKALDVYVELADSCHENGDLPATAEAWKDLAAIMLEAQRPTSAMALLTEVDKMIASFEDQSLEVVNQHVDTLVMLGQVVQSQRSNEAAVGYYRRALMLVADRDGLESSRIRELLLAAAGPDQELN